MHFSKFCVFNRPVGMGKESVSKENWKQYKEINGDQSITVFSLCPISKMSRTHTHTPDTILIMEQENDKTHGAHTTSYEEQKTRTTRENTPHTRTYRRRVSTPSAAENH